MITFDLLQGGFAGNTGERTTLYADGCFTLDRVLGERILNIRSGQLDPDQIQRARAAIEEADLASLPDLPREPDRVNPVTVSLRLKNVTRIVTLPPGTGRERMEALASADPKSPVGRVARLVTELISLTR